MTPASDDLRAAHPRLVGTIEDSGRRKPVPRTLQQAFPQSEGYQLTVEDAKGALVPLTEGALASRTERVAEIVSWAIVIGLACWVVRWAWLAPKVGG